jgi:hypothetical protein
MGERISVSPLEFVPFIMTIDEEARIDERTGLV